MVRDQVLLVDVIACNGQQVPPSQQSSPAISTLNNPVHLHIPGHQGHEPTVTVRDSYGTRHSAHQRCWQCKSATTGLAPASPSSTTTVVIQMLATSVAPGTLAVLPTMEETTKVRKSGKNKSKKEKYQEKPQTLASMVRKRLSTGKSTNSPMKKRCSLQLACTRSMSTSHIVHEEKDSQNTKKRHLSDVAQSSNKQDSVSANIQDHRVHPQSTGLTHTVTRAEIQDTNSFQDHHTLSDEEVFSASGNMTAKDMLRAGFLMLKQGQWLFHSINLAMSQQAKSPEMMEEKQARSLVAIETSNREMKDTIQTSKCAGGGGPLCPWESGRNEARSKSFQRRLRWGQRSYRKLSAPSPEEMT